MQKWNRVPRVVVKSSMGGFNTALGKIAADLIYFWCGWEVGPQTSEGSSNQHCYDSVISTVISIITYHKVLDNKTKLKTH